MTIIYLILNVSNNVGLNQVLRGGVGGILVNRHVNRFVQTQAGQVSHTPDHAQGL